MHICLYLTDYASICVNANDMCDTKVLLQFVI